MATNISNTQVQIAYTADDLENAIIQTNDNTSRLQMIIDDGMESSDATYSSVKIEELIRNLSDRISILEANASTPTP